MSADLNAHEVNLRKTAENVRSILRDDRYSSHRLGFREDSDKHFFQAIHEILDKSDCGKKDANVYVCFGLPWQLRWPSPPPNFSHAVSEVKNRIADLEHFGKLDIDISSNGKEVSISISFRVNSFT